MSNALDALANSFLQSYANGATADAGWSFAKALQQSRLDFSEESLDRLDRFFDAVRTRARPSREALQDTAPGRNCCALLAFYVVEYVRRRSGARIEWHDRASAAEALPSDVVLPDGTFTRLIAIAPDAGAVFLPLQWIEEQMLGARAPTSAADYVASTVAQVERHGPAQWAVAMEALGWLAAWKMIGAAAGHPVYPATMMSTNPREIAEWRGDPSTISTSVQAAARLLELNPDGASWVGLAYDGYMGDPSDRQDALMVVMHTYGASPLQIKIAFPYRPASESRPFAILRPALLASNLEDAQIKPLQAALERGIQGVVWPDGESWDGYRANAGDDRTAGPTREIPTTPSGSAPRANPAASASAPGSGSASAHYVPSHPADPSLEALIARLRESFGARQPRLSERTLATLVANPPAWMKPSDGLSEVFRQQRLLLREGRIVWGALVQANNLLFEPGPHDHPAMLVYSDDPYFDARPAELRQIGAKVFALKGTEPDDPELNSLARLITEEVDRSMGLRLPPVFSPQALRSAVFMVFRPHLPNGVLTCGLFPILTHPSTDAVLIVPFEFWPAELTILWRDRKL